ncbi:MAG: oprF 5 [Bacteroidota bacterium]|nr:oprF 5 [Bacteroidota bacterium]
MALVLSASSFAQSIITKDNVKGKAKEFYEAAYVSRNILLSDSFARISVQEKPNFIDGWILIGDNSLYLKRYDEGVKAYEKVKALKADYMYDMYLKLGKCYIGIEQYASARKCFQQFLQMDHLAAGDKKLAEKLVTDCDFAEEAIKHPVPFEPVNLGIGVNSSFMEAGPYLTADEKYLYFTRLIEEGVNFSQEDIYYSVKTGDKYGTANPIGDAINTMEHGEGSVCISASGKYLMFTSYDRPDGLGNADIYMARKVGEKWERANNLGSPINTPGWEGAPSLSADGKTLFFAAIRSGGMGERDIWMSTLTDNGTWGTPVNLGDSINTPFNDESPYIHPDGQTLYFSSNGWPGMGNYDLYMSKKLPNGKWSKAVNLGYPINTAGWEVSIFVTTDGTSAFFSSERKDSYGGMDIYKFKMPGVVKPAYTSYIRGNVYDAQSRESIQANVQLYDLETGKLFATLSSDKVNGIFLSTMPAGKNYAVEVLKDGYLFYSQNISLKDVKQGDPFEVNIPLHKIKVGEAVVLSNIFFDSEKFDLKSESGAELGVVMKLLEKNPSLKIEIGGHTDNTGTEEKNKSLSESRAKSVYDYLVSKGVIADRLSYKGYASSKPLAPNNTAEGKAKNRRTEFVVMAI